MLGLWTTLVSVGAGHEAHNYRETVSPWFRSLFLLQPDVDAMAAAPLQFHIHALVGMLLFALWPFTRLVHAFTAPLHYLFRPYIVYRSRDDRRRHRRRARPRAAGARSAPATATATAADPGRARSTMTSRATAAPDVDLRGQTQEPRRSPAGLHHQLLGLEPDRARSACATPQELGLDARARSPCWSRCRCSSARSAGSSPVR